jgi:S1-C subfamily serine protease
MRARLLRLVGWTGALLAWAAAATAWAQSDVEAQARALKRASDAVVGLTAQAVDDARTAGSLGATRQGSGVVIGDNGLVLTIGYLLIEAETVELATDEGRRVPARVVAYDGATGFGLVQALAPLGLEPVPLARGDTVAEGEPLVVVSGGAGTGPGTVTMARLAARRGFSGWWEYHVDGALFTTPARQDHSGAGLFNARGELLGIGSLWLADIGAGIAAAPSQRRPGNMFVPVELLSPILAAVQREGRFAPARRAWLGLNCVEADGELRVVRVTEDSPADVAGLERGDRIVRIDGRAVSTLEGLWKTLWGGAGTASERAVQLDIERNGKPLTLTVQSVDRSLTLRRPRGV